MNREIKFRAWFPSEIIIKRWGYNTKKSNLITWFSWVLLLPILSYPQDTICIPKSQVHNIYEGLKKYEWYKEQYPEREKDIYRLTNIVISQDSTIQQYVNRNIERDAELKELYDIKEKQAITIERRKNSLWWLWLGLGAISGGFIVSQF